MEEQLFKKIRTDFCLKESAIKPGKMMSSEAITYKENVFAFFSRKKKMVFKLGKDFDPDSVGREVCVFNPFKNRAPLHGWFEVPFTEKELWIPFAEQALSHLKKQLS